MPPEPVALVAQLPGVGQLSAAGVPIMPPIGVSADTGDFELAMEKAKGFKNIALGVIILQVAHSGLLAQERICREPDKGDLL